MIGTQCTRVPIPAEARGCPTASPGPAQSPIAPGSCDSCRRRCGRREEVRPNPWRDRMRHLTRPFALLAASATVAATLSAVVGVGFAAPAGALPPTDYATTQA